MPSSVRFACSSLCLVLILGVTLALKAEPNVVPTREEQSGGAGSSAQVTPTAPTTPPTTAPLQPRASEQEGVTPPKLLDEPGIAYPAGASGDVSVLLEITIALDGAVSKVEVLSGALPFAAVAQAEANKWRFEPARRDGVPVSVRIRFEVKFNEPTPEPASTNEPAAIAPSPRAANSREPRGKPLEVTVQGEKLAPGVTASLTRAEVRQIPGTFGDPFRALEMMPGVTPIVSGAPFFFVRGAPPGNIGYFLDGIRVPLLYHVGFGPSVVHPGLVERVDLYPAAYPASYGRFAGAIVAAETTEPIPKFHGEANVRLFDAGALAEAPFANGKGSALVGGRYSYTALLLSLLAPEVALEYWDYQARITYKPNPKDTLGVFSFGAFDFLGEERNGTTETLIGTEFHRVDLRYRHDFSERTALSTAVAVGVDRTRGEEGDGPSVVNRSIAPRAELVHVVSPQLEWRAGVDLNLDFYDLNVDNSDATAANDVTAEPLPEVPPGALEPPAVPGPGPGPGMVVAEPASEDRADTEAEDVFPTRRDVAVATYVSASWRPEPSVLVTPGLRLDAYHSLGTTVFAVEPRIIAEYQVSDSAKLKHTFGLAHQRPSFVIPIPGFQPAGLAGGLQQSLQSSAGLELELPADFVGQFTLFHNVFLNTNDILSVVRAAEDVDELDFDTRSLGRTVGAELFIKRPLTKRLGGFLTYTLSRSVQSLLRSHFVTTFDRSHVLNLALAYDLGRSWRAGTRFVFYTGIPTDVTSFGRGENARSPAFYRLDVRLEKRWQLSQSTWWSFIFEVLNTTLNTEVLVDCSGADCNKEEIGPITIPSLGVEAGF